MIYRQVGAPASHLTDTITLLAGSRIRSIDGEFLVGAYVRPLFLLTVTCSRSCQFGSNIFGGG